MTTDTPSLPKAVLACIVAGACALAVTAMAQPAMPRLLACADQSPPFVMFAKDGSGTGFSYELFSHIAHQIGRQPVITQLPWSRCLQDVKDGLIDVAIDAYDDAQRRKTYLYSQPYRTLTPQLFYREGGRIKPAALRSSADLQGFKGCGVREYTYEHYGLDAARLDRGAADDRAMLLKLQAGHCDYAIEELEFIVGGRNHSPKWLDESNLRSMRPAWAQGPKNHFLLGRTGPMSPSLLLRIDQAIADAEKSGVTARLSQRYLEPAAKAP